MRSRFKVLLAVGLSGVALALAARQLVPPRGGRPVAAPASEAGPGAEVRAGPAAAPAAAEGPLPGPPRPGPDAAAADTPAGPTDEAGAVQVGGWLEGRPLPLCGRRDSVALRTAPGGPPSKQDLQSCEAAYGEFPAVALMPIRSRRGAWIELPGGWARLDEVRTAEFLVVEGREYWHDLFNSSVAEVTGRRVVVQGDTDPCAGEVCGSAHGLWEQAEELRRRQAEAHPGGVPPALREELERQIEATEKAEAEGLEQERKRLEQRARETRSFELGGPPARGRKVEASAEGGGYLCCT